MRRSAGRHAAAWLAAVLLACAVARAAGQASGKSGLPSVAEEHFKYLRSYLHADYPNPHMDIFSESAKLCESEGPDTCAAVIVAVLDALVGADPKSRYRQLPRSKAAWAAYFKDDFKTCPALGSPSAPSASFNACRENAVRKLLEAGSGNSILGIDTKKPITLEWTLFFDLPACLLHQSPGDCNGAGCNKLLDAIGWTADKCQS